MTAKQVDGQRVVSDTDTQAPIFQRGSGKPVFWTQTRTLTLEDGTVTYGCQHCDFTADKAGAIRPHLRQHSDPDKPRKPRKVRSTGDVQVDALIKTLTEAGNKDKLVDYWRTRAQEAERKNAKIRKALTDLGFALPEGD